MRVVPAKPSRPPGKIKVNFEDMEKNREEELKKKAEEEKKRRYDENKRSFREVKRRSVNQQVNEDINMNAVLTGDIVFYSHRSAFFCIRMKRRKLPIRFK